MKCFDRSSRTVTGGGLRGRVALALVGLTTVAGGSGTAWGQERASEWGWTMHPMPWMWGAWGLGMMVMMLLFWGLVITGVVFAVRWLTTAGAGGPRDRALEILRERYARGEIDKEEFESKRRDLR